MTARVYVNLPEGIININTIYPFWLLVSYIININNMVPHITINVG